MTDTEIIIASDLAESLRSFVHSGVDWVGTKDAPINHYDVTEPTTVESPTTFTVNLGDGSRYRVTVARVE